MRVSATLLLLAVLLGCGDDRSAASGESTGGDAATSSESSEGENGSSSSGIDTSDGSTSTGLVVDCEMMRAELEELALVYAEEAELVGLSVSVESGTCPVWSGAWGRADVATDTMLTPAHLLRAGSITKSFTAALVLTLAEEGVLGLDDTLQSQGVDVPAAELITIRQLLAHTSGIADYQHNPAFVAALQAEPSRVWAPQELVDYGAELPPVGEPGAEHSYSNTGYVIAGMIIESATRQSYADALHEHVLDPLGLDHTFVEDSDTWSDPTATGYLVVENGAPQDATALYHASQVWSAGAVVATADDLRTFMAALLGSEWLSASSHAALTDLVPARGIGYGLGVFGLELGEAFIYGHDGAVMGFQAIALYEPITQTSVAVTFNQLDLDAMGRVTTDPALLGIALVAEALSLP